MDRKYLHASAENRTRITSMATRYSTTRPLMLVNYSPAASICLSDFLALGKVTCNLCSNPSLQISNVGKASADKNIITRIMLATPATQNVVEMSYRKPLASRLETRLALSECWTRV